MDTPQKRHSAVHVASPWRSSVPLPGTLDQADRQQLAFMYAGVSAGEAIIYAGVATQTFSWDLFRPR